MVNKRLRCQRKLNTLNSKLKSPFMIDADFVRILMPEDNGKQNQDDSYSNKY